MAGFGGAVAYLAAQELDRRVADPRSDDLILLGGLVTDRAVVWRPLGLVMHLLAGVAFAQAFQSLAAPRLPGPYWLRGVLAAQIENTILFPLLYPIERFHPAVKSGALVSLTGPTYLARSVWRHLALGAVLGALLTPSRP